MAPDHFTAVAARYAAYRPHYPAALVDALGQGETAWDVGTGNGQLAVALADHYAHVIATDLSRAQLAAAVPHPRVEYRCTPAEASGLPDASVDLVVAAQAAHWFDWPRFVAEVARVARPGALVALVSYGNAIVDGAAGRELADYATRVVGSYWPAGREHVENGYRDLVLPWTPVTPPTIAMTAEWTRDQLAGYVSSWSATARLVEHEGPAAFDAFCARLAATWPDNEPRSIRWPLTLRFARR
ncbi:MAG: SAM-dependent methyltransferase [Deltaproteobacteria bacterium]|nr:SAM-dependent methyltransferase [Deltaproteobacteria bacterium]